MWYNPLMARNTEIFRNALSSAAALAPMAGFTDYSFRSLCRMHGASLTVSEMISAKAVRLGDRKSLELMERTAGRAPFGIQLFGSDPEDFAFAARLAEERFAPDFIDINMGCPAPKITGPGGGSKLMASPSLAAEIAAATVSAVSVPVSCKIRSGFKEVTAPELAPLLEQAGVSCLFIHARTRDQMYHPPIDPEVIRQVKESVSIPVIGNGDVKSPEDALRLIRETGCDGVMIGRASLGDPFLFERVSAALQGKEIPPLPSLQDRIVALMTQAGAAVEDKGEGPAMRELRKHIPHYLRGVNGAAARRAEAVNVSSLRDLKKLTMKVAMAGYSRSAF